MSESIPIADAAAALDECYRLRRAVDARCLELIEQKRKLLDLLADVAAKATPYGEQDGGFVAMYLLPTGPIHRILAALGEAGRSVPPVLTMLPVVYVLEHWRPGSFDRTWAEEFADLGSPQRIGEMALRTWDKAGNPRDELCLRMLRGEHCEPVTLGWDGGEWGGRLWKGRVWAGHHRLWIYSLVGWPEIPVDVVPAGQTRGWPANHCAPAAGWA